MRNEGEAKIVNMKRCGNIISAVYFVSLVRSIKTRRNKREDSGIENRRNVVRTLCYECEKRTQ